MWFLKTIMGAGNSKYLSELSDDSDSDSDFDYFLEPRKEMITTDASAQSFLNQEKLLNLDKVLEIEKSLDNYEMVSLVFLLYEEPNYALQELILYLDGAQKNLLHTWASLEKSNSSQWQKKLIEALCVIKNYQVLRTLGYKKQDVRDYYVPHLPNSITDLNKLRKVMYIICEKLNRDKTEKFLNAVRLYCEEKSLPYSEFDPEFLELYFLKWETSGYSSMTDMLKRAFKVIEEDALWDIFEGALAPRETVEKKQSVSLQRSNVVEQMPRGVSTSTDTQKISSTADPSGYFSSLSGSMEEDNGPNLEDAHNHKYRIDPEHPGLLLIINQEEFYTEIEEEFKHLLPPDNDNKLESRTGTAKDKEELINVFTKFRFRIVVKENLTHEALVSELKETVKSVTIESSLFVCILSHGDKDVVYGSNSCSVKVSDIQEIMRGTNMKNLVEKPKVLILQSCQGKQCQKINHFSEDESFSITTDGPSSSKQSVPQTVDMLTFWATVPGYAAIRNKRTGSWFIQALVRNMTELGNKLHFADICTRIVDEVSSQTWKNEDGTNAMTPMVISTLRKAFYLSPMRK